MAIEWRGIEDVEVKFSPSRWVKFEFSNITYALVPRYIAGCETPFSVETFDENGWPYFFISTSENNMKGPSIRCSTGINRGCPIFFAKVGNKLTFSDYCKDFLSSEIVAGLDEVSTLEFLSFGFVTSRETMIKGVFQLQAGEIAMLDSGTFRTSIGYEYSAKELITDENLLLEELSKTSEELFDESIRMLKGKTAVVPLSGGYDSRFIAAMLKLGGYENVICVTYGLNNNPDSLESQRIANKLGFKWMYVEYSKKKWHEIFRSEIYENYIDSSHNYCAVSHYQEFPLLLSIKDSLGEDVIFLPGHTILSASQYLPTFSNKESILELENQIINKHYNLRCKPANRKVINKLHEIILDYNDRGLSQFQIFEIWNWRERQSKFITSANRVYEYFGFQWAMPLFQKRYMDFWKRVAFQFKFQKRLYHQFLNTKVFNQFQISFAQTNVSEGDRSGDQERLRWYLTKEKLKKYDFLIALYLKISRFGGLHSKNTCGFDVANPYLRKLAQTRDRKRYLWMEEIIKQEFGSVRSLDPMVFVAEYIYSKIASN